MLRRPAAWGSMLAGAVAAGPAYLAAWLVSRRRGLRFATRAGVRDALSRLGWRSFERLRVAPLGCGISNAVVSVDVDGERLVLKGALPVGTVLAYGARRFGPMPYAEDVSELARCRRELTALTRLRAAGVTVPRVVAADPDAGLLLLEHVDGAPLIGAVDLCGSAPADAFGDAVARAHRAGLVLTDCHPGNALWTTDGRAVLLDLEFAETREDLGDQFDARCGFDIAYASAFFDGPARAAFLRAACPDPSGRPAFETARDELRAYAPLFARERRRQQRHAA